MKTLLLCFILFALIAYTTSIQLNTVTVTSTTSLSNPNEVYYVNVGSNDITLTLPAISSGNTGTKFTIRRTDASGSGHLYLTANTGNTINGDQTIELITSQWMNIFADNDNSVWYVMANG